MAYRDEIEALSARHAALENQVFERVRELEDARQLLEDAKAKARLPILDNIKIAAPCSADWAKMSGDERVRACGDCKKNVYNLSDMTRDEAQALIVEKEGKLCVRFFRRHDGTILVKDCPVGVKRRRRRVMMVAGAAVTIVVSTFVGKSALTPKPQAAGIEIMGPPAVTPPPVVEPEVMGRLVVVPQPVEVKGEMVMGDIAPPAPPAPR